MCILWFSKQHLLCLFYFDPRHLQGQEAESGIFKKQASSYLAEAVRRVLSKSRACWLVHRLSPALQEAAGRRSKSSGPAWPTEQRSEMPSQKQNKRTDKNKKAGNVAQTLGSIPSITKNEWINNTKIQLQQDFLLGKTVFLFKIQFGSQLKIFALS